MSTPDTDPLTDDAPAARLPPSARRRLAALSLLGALMVALPLGQVLRYQNNELQSLLQQRAGLDPMARAVDVQRSLLLHRDVAGRVLRGQVALENERRVRQGEVDDHAAALALALVTGGWERAVHESDALREDWSLLARRIIERSVSAGHSDQSHRLLVEQALQVMDLLAAAAGSTEPAALQALATARAMPLQTLAELPQAEALPGGGLSDDARGALQSLQAAHLRARQQRFDALIHSAATRLSARSEAVRQARDAMVLALAALAGLAATLLHRLLRTPPLPPRRPEPTEAAPEVAVAVTEPAPPPAAAPRADAQLAGELLQRLRAAEDPAAAAGRTVADGAVQPQPQLPMLPPPA